MDNQIHKWNGIPVPPQPLIFGEDDFCKALTNKTKFELLDLVASQIDLFAKAPADFPRTSSEMMVDSYFWFMSSSFGKFPFNRDSDGMLYLAFLKFRQFERRIHPYEHWRKYYEPIYGKIETTFKSKDSTNFREGLCKLLDAIIHN